MMELEQDENLDDKKFILRNLPNDNMQIDQNLLRQKWVTKNGVCKLFLHSKCSKEKCPYVHDTARTKICQHFQRGNCKNGDDCDFNHQINSENMPICHYLQEYGECNKPGCAYKHKLKICSDFDKGFCSLGKLNCKKMHIQKKLCLNYSYGFCPLGPNCPDAHPKLFNQLDKIFLQLMDKNLTIIQCKICQEIGHKSTSCYQYKESDLNPEIYCFICNKKHLADFQHDQQQLTQIIDHNL